MSLRGLPRALLPALLLAGHAAAFAADAGSETPGTIPLPAPAAPAAPTGADSAEVMHLEDIVVTATKREKSVREIPSTIRALHGEDLEKTGARELQDFINLAPGITLQEGMANSQRKITIRGVGPGDGANQTTGQLFGDVPMTDPYSAYVIPDIDPFDLKNVEILMGPQGTIFGASALNGAIRYVPNTPELGTFSGRGFADWLSVSQGQTQPTLGGAINLPLGERFALRGAGVLQRLPGLYDNEARGVADADSARKWMGRIMARWDVSERFSANAQYMRQNSLKNDLSIANNTEGRYASDDRPGTSYSRINFDVANLDLRYAFDWATLVSQTSRITKLQDTDADTSFAVEALGQSGVQYLRGAIQADILGYVQELRLVSPGDGDWNWIAGVFMQKYRADFNSDQYVANTAALGPLLSMLPGIGGLAGGGHGVSLGGGRAQPLSASEYALFGELTRKFFDGGLELTTGARLYRTRLEADVTQYGAIVLAYFQRTETTSPFDQSERGISPKLAARWRLSPNISVYANMARGFQFGGINLLPAVIPTDSIPPSYRSSKLWSYEGGLRTDWLDRTLRADLTAFYIDWTDAQLAQATPTLVNTSFIDNVGAARSKGLEGTLAWLTPLPGVSVNASAAYIEAKTASDYGNGNLSVPAGTQLAASPRVQTATTLAYNTNVGSLLAGAALVHSYQGKAWNNIYHDHPIYDYQQFNFNLNLARPDLRFAPALTLGVTNLFDNRAELGIGGGAPGGSQSVTGGAGSNAFANQVYYNRPRAYSLRLSAEF